MSRIPRHEKRPNLRKGSVDQRDELAGARKQVHGRGLLFIGVLAFLLLAACGGGEKEGELFFQAGEGEVHVSGARTVDARLTSVTGPDHALYRPNETPRTLMISLQTADGSVSLLVELLEFHGSGRDSNVNSLTLRVDGANYSHGIYNRGGTVSIDTASDKSVRGSLKWEAVGNCVAAPGAPRDETGTCLDGFHLETVDVAATFELKSPKRLPLPKPVRATSTSVR